MTIFGPARLCSMSTCLQAVEEDYLLKDDLGGSSTYSAESARRSLAKKLSTFVAAQIVASQYLTHK